MKASHKELKAYQKLKIRNIIVKLRITWKASLVGLAFLALNACSQKTPIWHKRVKNNDYDPASLGVFNKAEFNTVYLTVEEQAYYPGGLRAWQDYLKRELHHPNTESQKQGAVFISFIVTTQGELKNMRVTRGINQAYDLAAIKLLQESGNWIPAKQQGQTVNSKLQIRISYN